MLSYSLGEYNDLYVQSDTLLLADIFDNFQTTCLEIYEPDPAHFLTAPGLAWQAAFKRTKVRLDMLLTIEKGLPERMCHSIYQYNNKEQSYL